MNINRLCPLCRKESFYVIPSTRFVTGIEKQEALSAFRDSISSKPCKVSPKTYFFGSAELRLLHLLLV